MNASKHYDCVVIGSGQGGTPLCKALAQSGLRTALVERKHVGGTCVNEGCTPTKTMVASARVAYLARRAVDYGVRTGPIGLDMGRIRQRKRDIVNSFRSANESGIQKTANLDLILGEASLTGPKSAKISLNAGGELSLHADRIFINTGTRAAQPAIPGLDSISYLDNASIMELDAIPEHLLVLGGGYIGLEFGQMFRRFGSRVTILQSGPQLLSREDSDVAQEVLKILGEDGVEVVLNAKAKQVSKSGGQIAVELVAEGRQQTVLGTHLLVATGRIPNTDTLNLAGAGVATDAKGFINVNARLETNVEGIFALGDVKSGPAFTHISYDDFRILRANLLQQKNVTIENRLVPYTVFIDPQLGRVGLSENEARLEGRKFRVAKLPMTSVARALETDETRGFMKAIVDSESGQILGAAVLGIEGGEIMAILEVAMMGKLPYTDLKDAVFAHPTLAESLNNLFTKLD